MQTVVDPKIMVLQANHWANHGKTEVMYSLSSFEVKGEKPLWSFGVPLYWVINPHLFRSF